jgi:hypothetical protein
MALTKAEIITAVRRLTRLDNSVPYTDDQIAQFINEAIEELSMLSPFDVYHETIDTKHTIVYTTSVDMIDFFGIFYYPLVGDRLVSQIDANASTLPLQDASAFPNSGYAVVGDMLRWEIVRYTGKNGNSLTGVTRGVYGKRLDWAEQSPVHVWQSGVWWKRLEIIPTNSLFDIGTPDEENVPTKASRQSRTIYLNQYPVEGYGNLVVAGFTTPPPLIKSDDTIRGLENKEMPVIYLASIKVLSSLGTEEAQRCAQSYMPLFQLELTSLQQQIDRVFRGMTLQTNINMGR